MESVGYSNFTENTKDVHRVLLRPSEKYRIPYRTGLRGNHSFQSAMRRVSFNEAETYEPDAAGDESRWQATTT